MAEQRHKTVLEIGVDDREVRNLGRTMDQAFSAATVEAFERSLDRAGRAMEKLASTQGRLAEQLERMNAAGQAVGGAPGAPPAGGGGGGGAPRAGAPGGAAPPQQRGGGFLPTFGGALAGSYLGTRAGMQRGAGVVGAAMQPGGFVGQMAGAVPVLGPAFQGAAAGVQQFYGQFVAAEQAQARTFGATGLTGLRGGRLAAVGQEFGLGPQELPAAIAQIGQATGLRGEELREAAPELLRMQQTMGFGGLQAIVGGAGAAGGTGEQTADIISDAVQAGVQAGFREGRLDRFFQQIGGWIEQLRTRGVNITAESALGFSRAVTGLGGMFQGEAGLQQMQGMQQAFAGAGQRRGVGSLIALRAAGLAGGGFGELNFAQAQRELETNPGKVLRNTMVQLKQAGISNPDQLQVAARNVFSSMGHEMSATQAFEMAQQIIAGDEEGLAATGATQEGQKAASELLEKRGQQAKSAFRTASHEAGLQRERVQLGGSQEIRRAAQTIHSLEMKLAKETLPAFAGGLEKATQMINSLLDAFKTGDFAGLFTKIGEMAKEALKPLFGGGGIADVVGDALGIPDLGGGLQRAGASFAELTERPADEVAADAVNAVSGFVKNVGQAAMSAGAALAGDTEAGGVGNREAIKHLRQIEKSAGGAATALEGVPEAGTHTDSALTTGVQ